MIDTRDDGCKRRESVVSFVETLATYPDSARGRRSWETASAWLYPGDEIAVVRRMPSDDFLEDIAAIAELVGRLRSLARGEHSDLSVVDQAADVIVACYVPPYCLPVQKGDAE